MSATGARRAILDRRTFYLFILLTSNPFLRLSPRPSRAAISIRYCRIPVSRSIRRCSTRLCRFLDHLLLCGRRADRRPHRRGLGALCAALDADRLDFPDLGIAMGSYWAYYTLGWGGFWFWDPVENASLMPWLAGTALLHSAVVMEKRDALKIWTILLAILTFSLSLIGTFLVRSGVLTSVHSFASDPTRGVFILVILVLFIGGSLALFAWRAPRAETGRPLRAGLARRRARPQQSAPDRPAARPFSSARFIRWLWRP